MPCWECEGRCVLDDFGQERNCDTCGGEGSLEPEDVEALGEDAFDVAMAVALMYSARERAWSPCEWLEQPYRWTLAYTWLSRWIFGEFEDRKRKLADRCHP